MLRLSLLMGYYWVATDFDVIICTGLRFFQQSMAIALALFEVFGPFFCSIYCQLSDGLSSER